MFAWNHGHAGHVCRRCQHCHEVHDWHTWWWTVLCADIRKWNTYHDDLCVMKCGFVIISYSILWKPRYHLYDDEAEINICLTTPSANNRSAIGCRQRCVCVWVCVCVCKGTQYIKLLCIWWKWLCKKYIITVKYGLKCGINLRLFYKQTSSRWNLHDFTTSCLPNIFSVQDSLHSTFLLPNFSFAHGAMDGRIDPSWWAHWTISRSSHCSTTGVTKAVVCAILSVGWCM